MVRDLDAPGRVRLDEMRSIGDVAPVVRGRSVPAEVASDLPKRRLIGALVEEDDALLVGEDLDECLVEGILPEGFGGRRHAVHVLAFPEGVAASSAVGAPTKGGTKNRRNGYSHNTA
jgi:hypothetical protein